MPRKKRIKFPGATYHVMARGNEQKEIFRCDDDRKMLLKILGHAVDRFHLIVHGYCLMPNHYHLVVETPKENLSQAIAWIHTTYVTRFNLKYQRSGHLFQGRYKACLVEDGIYGRQLLCYVHLNPVRPKDKNQMIPKERWKEFNDYPWSSHRSYRDGKAEPGWLNLDWLKSWGSEFTSSCDDYRSNMKACFSEREGVRPHPVPGVPTPIPPRLAELCIQRWNVE